MVEPCSAGRDPVQRWRLWTGPIGQRTCFTRAVNSCTRLYTDLSSRIRRAIFEVAWITVVWSRPPNSLPIFGRDEGVSSRERQIATWGGETLVWETSESDVP